MALWTISGNGTLAYVPKVERNASRLIWVDRNGQIEPLSLPPASEYGNPRISPSGNQVLFTKLDEKNKLWIYDLDQGRQYRVTDDNGEEWLPVWAPDGKRIVFNSTRLGGTTGMMFLKPVNEVGGEEVIVKTLWPCPHSWTRDGKLLAYREASTTTAYDIWTITMQGERKAEPFLVTPKDEDWPQFSPDGQWIAYQSDSSGQVEVYVLPSTAGKSQPIPISDSGGYHPLWSPDGAELFYMNNNRFMAVPFKAKPALMVGRPRVLFEVHNVTDTFGYDITPDGKRFIMVEEGEAKSINVVLNWFEELKRLVPTGK